MGKLDTTSDTTQGFFRDNGHGVSQRVRVSFRASVREAKRSWAHDQLFENHKTDNIWSSVSAATRAERAIAEPF